MGVQLDLALQRPEYLAALDVPCPKCHRPPGQFCRNRWVTRGGKRSDPKCHRARMAAANFCSQRGHAWGTCAEPGVQTCADCGMRRP